MPLLVLGYWSLVTSNLNAQLWTNIHCSITYDAVTQKIRLDWLSNPQNYFIIYTTGEITDQWLKTGEIITSAEKTEFFDLPNLNSRFYRVDRCNGMPLPGMTWIQAGTFLMGSPTNELERQGNEGPQTLVTISRGFWMSRFEVTQKEYQTVMSNNPSVFTGDPYRPVENVGWPDATNYCWFLTMQEQSAGRLPEGYVYRLPTEAEWEYACRAGTATRFCYGDDPQYTQLGDYAWYYSNSGYKTHPVGQKQPNAWGLYDMHGNVWEWCLDIFSNSLPGGSVTDPTGNSWGSSRVGRGGCWYGNGKFCRSAYRGDTAPDGWINTIGFRPVLAPKLD